MQEFNFYSKGLINKVFLDLKDEEMSIEELNQNDFFTIHLNNRIDFKITYINDKICLEIFNKNKEEVLELGPKLIFDTSPVESWQSAKNLSQKLSQINSNEMSIYFFQSFLRPKEKSLINVYTIRKILDKNDFISISIPFRNNININQIKSYLAFHHNYLDSLWIYEKLTNRQKEVFKFTALGLSQIEIADRLQLSTETVKVFRKQIKDRTGWSNSAKWRQVYIELGLSE
jgi:DNA-binding CsgD family transcriptional regulator